jgi:hypothetical protein
MEPLAINESDFAAAPRVIADANDNLHILFLDAREDPFPLPDLDLFYTIVSPNGETILEDRKLFDAAIGTTSGLDAKFDSDGFVHLFWSTVSRLGWNKYDDRGNFVNGRVLFSPENGFFLYPRIFPLPDGTSHLLYTGRASDLWIEVHYAKIDAAGQFLIEPVVLSHEHDGESCGDMDAAIDRDGNLHIVWGERSPTSELFYRSLDVQTGLPGEIRQITRDPDLLLSRAARILIDDLGRPAIYFLADRFEALLKPGRWSPNEAVRGIIEVILDPQSGIVLTSKLVDRVGVGTHYMEFATDGKGRSYGIYGDDGPSWRCLISCTDSSLRCREGAVHAASSSAFRRLTVNGSAGDAGHEITLPGGVPISLAISTDEDAADRPFYVQARKGAPDHGDPRWLPGIGLGCFDFLDHASADAIWNGLGGLYGRLGSSRIKRHPIPNPAPNPGVFFTVPGHATAELPPGTTVTFQGLQYDPASRKGVSVTNAVILTIE